MYNLNPEEELNNEPTSKKYFYNLTEEEELIRLKSEVKNLKSKIKESKKPKTITISNDVHSKLKRYCTLLNINIGDYIEKLILNELDTIIYDEKSYEDIYEENLSNCVGKFNKNVDSNKNFRYLKTDSFILHSLLEFVGNSVADGKPIYKIKNEECLSNISDFRTLVEGDLELNNLNYEFVKYNEISKNIKNYDFDITILQKIK